MKSAHKRASHALRVRGLKHHWLHNQHPPSIVARSTRAWIETSTQVEIRASLLSHALRVRGLKQRQIFNRAAEL